MTIIRVTAFLQLEPNRLLRHLMPNPVSRQPDHPLDKIRTIKILDVRAGDRDFSPALEPAGLVTSGGTPVTAVTPVTSVGLVIIILIILAIEHLIKALIIKVTQMGLEITHRRGNFLKFSKVKF